VALRSPETPEPEQSPELSEAADAPAQEPSEAADPPIQARASDPPTEAPPPAAPPAPPAAPAPSAPITTEAVPEDRAGHRKRKGPFGFLKELPALIIIAFVLALLIKTFLVQAFYIPSPSMDPTLKVGDRVLVNKLAYKFHGPSRGDVIVFSNPGQCPEPHRNPVSAFVHWITEGLGVSAPACEDFIKRVIGLPGDVVEERSGVIYVNGKRLVEPYLNSERDTRSVGPWRVEAGHLFVLGDNRVNSNDSRFGLGQIPIDHVVGKAFIIIWPPSRFGGLAGGLRIAG
jgi:signal peptidase I